MACFFWGYSKSHRTKTSDQQTAFTMLSPRVKPETSAPLDIIMIRQISDTTQQTAATPLQTTDIFFKVKLFIISTSADDFDVYDLATNKYTINM